MTAHGLTTNRKISLDKLSKTVCYKKLNLCGNMVVNKSYPLICDSQANYVLANQARMSEPRFRCNNAKLAKQALAHDPDHENTSYFIAFKRSCFVTIPYSSFLCRQMYEGFVKDLKNAGLAHTC